MLKLLRAHTGRMRTEKAFWVAMGGMTLYVLLICWVAFYNKYIAGTGSGIIFDELLFSAYGIKGYLTIPAILLGIFSSLFIGKEFSDGTVRNKIIVGRTRTELYLSYFITCSAVGLLMNLLYLLLVCAIGFPLFGLPTLPASTLALWVIAGTLAVLSYAALFTLLSMLVQNKTTVSITVLLTLFFAILAVTFLFSRLGATEFIEVYEMVNGAETITETIPNPNFLTPGSRAVVEFVVDLLPTGQSLQISGLTALRPVRMILCSIGVILAANLAGIIFFCRKDLK